jgi:predicted amidophosphoribosyltransferase
MNNMICNKCNKPFNAGMASCGTGITYNIFRCPHCQHEEIVQRNYKPIDMLRKTQGDV